MTLSCDAVFGCMYVPASDHKTHQSENKCFVDGLRKLGLIF